MFYIKNRNYYQIIFAEYVSDFFLIGIGWTLLYSLVLELQPTAILLFGEPVTDSIERGSSVLLYFSFLASEIAEEWDAVGKDCVIMPKGGYPVFHYQPQPDQAAWRVCLNSPWQDLLAHGMGKVMDDFGVDVREQIDHLTNAGNRSGFVFASGTESRL